MHTWGEQSHKVLSPPSKDFSTYRSTWSPGPGCARWASPKPGPRMTPDPAGCGDSWHPRQPSVWSDFVNFASLLVSNHLSLWLKQLFPGY